MNILNVFIFVFFIMIILGEYKKDVSLKKVFYIISLIFVFALFSLKSKYIGTDTINYVNNFEDIANNSLSYVKEFYFKSEPGLYVLMRIFSYISKDYVVCWIFLGIIVFTIYGFFYYKNSQKPIESFYLWVVFGGLDFLNTGIRQSMAIIVTIIAYMSFVKKKYILTFVLILIAGKFHHSAYCFFVIFLSILLDKFKNKKFIFVIVSIIFIVFVQFWINYLNNLFEYEYGNENVGNGIIRFLLIMILSIPIFLNKNEHENNKIDFSLTYVFIILWFGRMFDRCFERPSLYFLPYFCLLIPTLFNKNNKFFYYFYYFILFVLFIYYVYNHLNAEYKFFFEV